MKLLRAIQAVTALAAVLPCQAATMAPGAAPPSAAPSSAPSETPVEVLAFYFVDLDNLNLGNQGRIAESTEVTDPKYTDELVFDWKTTLLRHTRVQLEVEVSDTTKSVLFKNKVTGKTKCVNTNARVFLYPKADKETGSYPIEVGQNLITVTPYPQKKCIGDKGEKRKLNLLVSYGSKNDPGVEGFKCKKGFIIGYQYIDELTGDYADLIPGPELSHCIKDGLIYAMFVSCVDNFVAYELDKVAFKLLNNSGSKLLEKSSDSSYPFPVFATTKLKDGKQYNILGQLVLKGLKGKSKLEKSFKTAADCPA